MSEKVAVFIAGVAVGLAIFRVYVELMIGRFASTRCDYCEFKRKRETRR